MLNTSINYISTNSDESKVAFFLKKSQHLHFILKFCSEEQLEVHVSSLLQHRSDDYLALSEHSVCPSCKLLY